MTTTTKTIRVLSKGYNHDYDDATSWRINNGVLSIWKDMVQLAAYSEWTHVRHFERTVTSRPPRHPILVD